MFLYRYIHENYYLDQIEAEIEDIVTECVSLVSELEMIEVEENMNMYFGEALMRKQLIKKRASSLKLEMVLLHSLKRLKISSYTVLHGLPTK